MPSMKSKNSPVSLSMRWYQCFDCGSLTPHERIVDPPVGLPSVPFTTDLDKVACVALPRHRRIRNQEHARDRDRGKECSPYLFAKLRAHWGSYLCPGGFSDFGLASMKSFQSKTDNARDRPHSFLEIASASEVVSCPYHSGKLRCEPFSEVCPPLAPPSPARARRPAAVWKLPGHAAAEAGADDGRIASETRMPGDGPCRTSPSLQARSPA
jgi:hypothetical protein